MKVTFLSVLLLVLAVVSPAAAQRRAVEKMAEDKLNHLVVLKPDIGTPITYWAGFA